MFKTNVSCLDSLGLLIIGIRNLGKHNLLMRDKFEAWAKLVEDKYKIDIKNLEKKHSWVKPNTQKLPKLNHPAYHNNSGYMLSSKI